MRLHNISSVHDRPKSRRVGRGNGSGRGTFSGRGVKGQKARSGFNIPRTFIGGSTSLVQRLPKLKGFTSSRVKPVTVNLARITSVFKDGETVSIISLLEKGLISTTEATQGVKVVGASAKITHKLTFDTESGPLTLTKKLLA